MAKKMTLMLVVTLLIIGGIIGWKLFVNKMMAQAMASQKQPPVAVSTAKATEQSWQPTLRAVGTFSPVQGILVAAELDGTIAKIAFESGAAVKEGDLLLQQDTSLEEAQLASAEARGELARLSLDRAKELRARETNAQADLDAATASSRQTQADIAGIKATIAKKTIRAPFSGRLGIRQVNLGQFIRAGATIVPLEAQDPIYLNFTLPQQNAANVAVGQVVQARLDAYPGAVFEGTVSAMNPNMDSSTRNFQIQATLKNAEGQLRSGMFGTVDLLLPVQDKVITLPLTTIVYNPYGDAVYAVESGAKDAKGQPLLTVRQQFVKTGPTRGDQIAILKGVKPGDEIVTAGQMKLRNGSPVFINNSITPGDSPAPAVSHP